MPRRPRSFLTLRVSWPPAPCPRPERPDPAFCSHLLGLLLQYLSALQFSSTSEVLDPLGSLFYCSLDSNVSASPHHVQAFPSSPTLYQPGFHIFQRSFREQDLHPTLVFHPREGKWQRRKLAPGRAIPSLIISAQHRAKCGTPKAHEPKTQKTRERRSVLAPDLP